MPEVPLIEITYPPSSSVLRSNIVFHHQLKTQVEQNLDLACNKAISFDCGDEPMSAGMA
jgi:hypothetical protein